MLIASRILYSCILIVCIWKRLKLKFIITFRFIKTILCTVPSELELLTIFYVSVRQEKFSGWLGSLAVLQKSYRSVHKRGKRNWCWSSWWVTNISHKNFTFDFCMGKVMFLHVSVILLRGGRGVCIQGVCLWGLHPVGVCIQWGSASGRGSASVGWGLPNPPGTRKAGGMHPTGMLTW